MARDRGARKSPAFYERLSIRDYSGSMGHMDLQLGLDEAFERIEETILPSISMMLDTLLDAATPGPPAINPAVYAAALRTLGRQLEQVAKPTGAVSPAHLTPQ